MFGFTPTQARELAYECAMKLNVNFPDVWIENKWVGPD
jgi:hypothetical protein